MTYYLAIDIGASSGRHIVASLNEGKLELREIHRFENSAVRTDAGFIWDVGNLVREIKCGLKKCGELGIIPKSVAIDTWGVDYVLLDAEKKEILPAMAYRDEQVNAAEQEVAKIISQDELYSLTGIQKMNFNTIYQLWRDKKSGKLEKAEHLLMMPEYLAFKLCGQIKNEYTIASTTNLINAEAKTWDDEIFNRLGYPRDLLKEPVPPCTFLGNFTEEVKREVGFDAEVIFSPSHDTASAVAACPIDTDCVYISSGTWSLIGTENESPKLSEEAKYANFTNEGGINYRFRFLKNIMGMWLFQSIRRDIGKTLTYDEMMHLAEKSSFEEYIDPNSPELVAPENMVEAIRGLLEKPELPIGDVLKCVYISLAKTYADSVAEIEKISKKEIREIHIVGGGSRDAYLNRLTREYTGKKVFVGLTEATATGNILAQIMYDKKLSISEVRKIVRNSFDIREI